MTAPLRSIRSLAGLALLALVLGGCGSMPEAAPMPRPGLVDLLDRPAERALFEGQRAYDEAQYVQAERLLRRALDGGLASPRDRAHAHKLLAFVTCTSGRGAECEAHFRAARAADPSFALARAEAGHPKWGPVYRRMLLQ